MSQPPFTMSKYATELDLLRDKCAWLERELAKVLQQQADADNDRVDYAEQCKAALCLAHDALNDASDTLRDLKLFSSSDRLDAAISAVCAALSKKPNPSGPACAQVPTVDFPSAQTPEGAGHDDDDDDPLVDLDDIAGIPCRFCMGRGSVTGACLECGKPKAVLGVRNSDAALIELLNEHADRATTTKTGAVAVSGGTLRLAADRLADRAVHSQGRAVPCVNCNGSGLTAAYIGASPDECSHCGGTGKARPVEGSQS